MSLTVDRVMELLKENAGSDWCDAAQTQIRRFAFALERELMLKWTYSQPTVPGEYWYRSLYTDEPYIINVSVGSNGVEWYYGDKMVVGPLQGQFAGPIPKPLEEQ